MTNGHRGISLQTANCISPLTANYHSSCPRRPASATLTVTSLIRPILCLIVPARSRRHIMLADRVGETGWLKINASSITGPMY